MLKCTIFTLLIGLYSSFACKKPELSEKFYRSGVVIVDTVKLPNSTILLKGTNGQIITQKSTEEATYIKTKQDSGKVYYENIKTLCWLKNDAEVRTIESGKLYKLQNDVKLIVYDIKDDYLIVEFDSSKFKIHKASVYFDNKVFFDMILK